MDNIQNIKYMLANPKPDLSELENEIRSVFNTPDFKLNDLQVNALAIICKYGCLFGNLPVGSGKTIVSLAAGLVHRSKRCLLFVPSDLIAQLTIVDIKHFESILGYKLDWCCLDGKSQKDRIYMMDKHRITIIPYSLLSTKDTFDLIEASYADMIVFDEAHVLSDTKSARTRRIMSYLNKNTEINVILLSGTMSSKSLLDYHHTIARALHQFCPLPFSYYDVKLIQDATAWDREDKFTRCIPLCRINPKLDQGGGIVNVDKARQFLRTLLNASPCVIISDAQSVNCSMMVHVIDDVKLPEKLIKIIDEVDATWTTPSGDLIMDAIVKYGICSELSDGFWYRKYWPKGTPEWAIELFKKEKELESMIRSFILKRHRDKLDTPLLVYEALYHGNDPRLERIQPFYNEFRQECEKHDEEYERKSETRWICHSKEKEAIKWCRGRKKGILFYEWDATGESLYKTLKEQGFDVVFCPSNCEPELIKKNCFQVMSYAHHRGKNLQHQFETLFYNLPKNAKILEQAMGRTHRQGQKADCVSYWFILATKQDRAAFRRIILKAKWQETTMQQQKILIASFAQPEYAKLVRE